MDHNMDFLKHSVHKRTQDFIELNLDNNMLPTITRPTRITNNSATLIDNIMVSQNLMTNTDSSIIVDDISDHLPSLVKLTDQLQKMNTTKVITSRNLNENNLTKIKDSLTTIDWSAVITENVDKSFDLFHNELLKTLDRHAPIVTRKLNNKNYRREPWITPALL